MKFLVNMLYAFVAICAMGAMMKACSDADQVEYAMRSERQTEYVAQLRQDVIDAEREREAQYYRKLCAKNPKQCEYF